MNAIMAWSGGRAPPRKIRRGLAQDLVGLAQLAHLPLQGLDPLRSALVGPARMPRSRSACRTHLRSVSAVQPIFAAIEPIASHCEA